MFSLDFYDLDCLPMSMWRDHGRRPKKNGSDNQGGSRVRYENVRSKQRRNKKR